MGHCSVPPSARASTHIRPIYIEDVYLGMCMKHLGIAPTNPPARPCSSPTPLLRWAVAALPRLSHDECLTDGQLLDDDPRGTG
ncbi:hypothetical protein N1851_034389 [Merluccius polli]|uniref:Hexosyltransferase n=1 Tax=Merluccius polli TaxID=89951 RepID=A0AA47LZM7_MERPO|nr:hypothetical protein N1851_034389 [Merluccius polli]